jgi:AcrR family transcriptional regulator
MPRAKGTGSDPRRRKSTTPYQRARDAGRQALRDAVLKAASELLAAEGAGALTMRRIADDIGSSTTVLYTIFDSKNGILDAMVQAGHEALRKRLEAIPSDDAPFERLAETARVYRSFALQDPARYQFLFGSAIPGYWQSQDAKSAAQASFDALADVVRECQRARIIRESADPAFVSEILIAAAHGAISLELSGHFDDPGRADERFSILSDASCAPFLVKKRAGPSRRPSPGAAARRGRSTGPS